MPRLAKKWLQEVLKVLYRVRPATRTDIVTATQLNAASVSHALNFLLQRGVALKSGELESNGGRPPETLALNPAAGLFVAIDLEGTRVRFARTSFDGQIQKRWEEPIDFGTTFQLEQVIRGIDVVLENTSASEFENVLGIGISYPGLIDEEGRITAVNLGWDRLPLIAGLGEAINLPIYLERDARTSIIAERWLGRAKDVDNWIYVVSENGVGIGLFLDGRMHAGYREMAGELGHITIDPLASDECRCGRRGCLEAITSAPNIVRQYLERKHISDRPSGLRVKEVFECARSNDEAAIAVVDRVGFALGLALAHCVNILSPQMIVCGGDLMEGADLLLPRIRRHVERHTLPQLSSKLVITTSGLGEDIRLTGAASLAFRRTIADPELLAKLCTAGRRTGQSGGLRAAADRKTPRHLERRPVISD